MSKKNRISIITSTLNCGKALNVTAKSISDCESCDIEWIVIDGGSNTDTIESIKSNEKIISYWISESDEGIYHAWNKGIKKATGDWIMFLGAGDILNKDWAQYISNASLVNDIIYADLLVNESVTKNYVSKACPWNEAKILLKKTMCLKHPGLAHNKRLFTYKKFIEEYRVISDWVFLSEANIEKGDYQPGMLQAEFSFGGISTSYDGAKTAFLEARSFRNKSHNPMSFREQLNFIIYIGMIPLRKISSSFL